eukprot:scaffold26201_cov18-Tisochrysis_lutea.AAC.1
MALLCAHGFSMRGVRLMDSILCSAEGGKMYQRCLQEMYKDKGMLFWDMTDLEAVFQTQVVNVSPYGCPATHQIDPSDQAQE